MLESTPTIGWVYSWLHPTLEKKWDLKGKKKNSTTHLIKIWMIISQFTRNAADHARGRAPTHCFAPRLLDHAEGAREFVIKLSVVSTRLSMRLMNLDFSEDGHSRQLVSLKVWKKKCIYQTQSEQAHLLALYEICGDMILRTMCTPWPELEVHYWNCRNELERRSHQIWWTRQLLALKLTSVRLARDIGFGRAHQLLSLKSLRPHLQAYWQQHQTLGHIS